MGHTDQWEVVARCLKLAAAMIEKWIPEDELLVIVAGGEDLPLAIVQRRFEEDRSRIRAHLGCTILYHRGTNMYTIKNAGLLEPIIAAAIQARHDDE